MLSNEQLVIRNLQSDARRLVSDVKYDSEMRGVLESVMVVLDYYMLKSDFESFVREIGEQFTSKLTVDEQVLEVLDVIDNPDGSANITFEMGSKVREHAVGEGINMMLLKAMLGGDQNDIVRWSYRGKEEERVDSIMSRYDIALASLDREFEAELNND